MNWITVKEKTPNKYSRVLVWFTGIYNEPKIAFFAVKSFYINEHNDDDITKWVSHWMPLPDAPNSCPENNKQE